MKKIIQKILNKMISMKKKTKVRINKKQLIINKHLITLKFKINKKK